MDMSLHYIREYEHTQWAGAKPEFCYVGCTNIK